MYLNGVWVYGIDNYAVSLQGFDLSAPAERKASYTNSFTIEDTEAVRILTEGAEQIDAYGDHPYSLLSAEIVENGEMLFHGLAQLTEFSDGWSVTLLSEKLGFFDSIDNKKISDLDLSDYDHVWSLDTISAYAGKEEGVVYPIVDPGVMDADIIPYDTITPAVYMLTLAKRIVNEAGYKPKGEWLTDELIKRAALPYVNGSPIAQDQQWVDERTARVTCTVVELGKSCDTKIPFNIDNDFNNGWVDGIFDESLPDVAVIKPLDNFDTNTHEYVCRNNMTLRVQAFQSFNVTILSGTCESHLIIKKNGQEVGKTYWKRDGVYNAMGRQDQIEIDKEIKCKQGDRISIEFMFGKLTWIGKYYVELSFDAAKTWASFIPVADVAFGTVWPVAKNLPDMSQKDLILSCAYLICGDFRIDEETREFEIIPLDNVREKLNEAENWSNRIDDAYVPKVKTLVEGLGQRNTLKWTEQSNKARIGYGDGVILTEAENYPATAPLLEMPFTSVVTSSRTLSGYGSPVLIETRTWSGTGDQRTVSSQSAPPCIVLIEPTYTQDVKTKTLNDEGNLVDKLVRLTGCWFGRRPGPIQNDRNRLTLCFSALQKQSEQSIISRSYKTLQNALKRPMKFTPYLFLRSSDIAKWSQGNLVRFTNVQAGKHYINDSIFYVNEISSYRSGVSCPVTLIPLSE